MATQALQEEFFAALEASKSYHLLSAKEQTALKEAFKDATDDQLQRGLEEIKKDAVEMEKLETDLQKKEEEQIRLAEEIKKTLDELQKAELQENIAKDRTESDKAAEMLLAKIEGIPEEEEKDKGKAKKKRKKILGLF